MYVIYRLGGPYRKKTVPKVLSASLGRRPGAVRTSQPVNNIYIYIYIKILIHKMQARTQA